MLANIENIDFVVSHLFSQIYGELRGNVVASRNEVKEKWFSWSHSYSKVFPQLKNEKYNPAGYFESLHAKTVENRDRVKCIDAKFGKCYSDGAWAINNVE